jgi:hypothetical protein
VEETGIAVSSNRISRACWPLWSICGSLIGVDQTIGLGIELSDGPLASLLVRRPCSTAALISLGVLVVTPARRAQGVSVVTGIFIWRAASPAPTSWYGFRAFFFCCSVYSRFATICPDQTERSISRL